MTEQERKKAFENQRKNAERRAKMADGTFEAEQRALREKRLREEQRRKKQIRALKQRLFAAVIVVIVILIIAVAALFKVYISKKNSGPQRTLPTQTSQESATKSIEAANEPGEVATAQQEQENQAQPETIQTQVQQPETTQQAPSETVAQTAAEQTTSATSLAAESVAETVNANTDAATGKVIDPSGIVIPDWITVDLIHVNEVSRPAIALGTVNDIAIHYVANPGSSAKANRDYFDSLDNPEVEGAGRQASAHLIVGLEGEVVQCLPLNELAYAVRSRNPDTISIEVCHPDETGKFSDTTYNTLVKLTAWLLQQEGLTPDHVIRHYDCDGKACPLYYVEHEDAWNQLKQDIADYYYANPNIQ